MTDKHENSDVNIRPAKEEDMSQIVEMIQELADFEKMPEGPTLTAADLARDAFHSAPPLFRCLVAEREGGGGGGGVLGYAIYFDTYSTWEGRSLMLEDLYVRRGERGGGVGGTLFDAVAAEAVAIGCRRVDFHVLSWNPARRFYETRGAANLTDAESWCYYRLAGEALRTRASAAAATLPLPSGVIRNTPTTI